jgi:hypothetical protein
VARVEGSEHVRSNLFPQFFDVCGGGLSIERHTVDQLKGLRPHPDGHVVSTKFASAPKNRPQADVGEGHQMSA